MWRHSAELVSLLDHYHYYISFKVLFYGDTGHGDGTQKAEHLHRYAHSSLTHPLHLPVTAVSGLAHPGRLGLGRICVPQMYLWGWMLAAGGRRSQAALAALTHLSGTAGRVGEQWSKLNTGSGCGRNWAELGQDRDLGRSSEVALKPELGMVTDPGVGIGVR